MGKLYVKLQTPTIELKVTAKDASGATSSMVVGFKRYETEEGDDKIKILQDALTEYGEEEGTSENLDNFIKNEIVYLKKVELEVGKEDGKNSPDLHIPDTRRAKPNETFWGSSEECLSVLVDLFLASQPWKVSLIASQQKALMNNDYGDALTKN